MHLSIFLFTSLVAAFPHLEARDDVSNAKAVLVALKASAFCSSFVPIKDVTSTSTIKGPNGVTATTVCAGAQKRATTAATSATTAAKATTTPVKCNVGRAELKGFACDVITKACVAYVKPNTITTTTSVPGTTSIVTVTSSCAPPPPCGTLMAINFSSEFGVSPNDASTCTLYCESTSDYGNGCNYSYIDSSGDCIACSREQL